MNLKDKIEIIDRNRINDSRGFFLKIMTGKEKGLPNYTGEIYLTMANSNEHRGGHYHKLANEWFTIIEGKAILRIEDIKTKEKMEIFLDSDNPKTVKISPLVAHNFYNEFQNYFLLLAYTDIHYDPVDTIIYSI